MNEKVQGSHRGTDYSPGWIRGPIPVRAEL